MESFEKENITIQDVFNPLWRIRREKDKSLKKDLLFTFCEVMSVEELEKQYLKDAERVLDIFGLFVETGLARTAPAGSHARAFLMKMTGWLLTHQNEFQGKFWEIFDRLYPKLRPIGYLENDIRIYNVADWADMFCLTPDEVKSASVDIDGVELFSDEMPGPDVLIN